ncbi:MAG: molecular chaperone HtpG [Clostridia bacterium]|nr:molecular chaperone HtpG [Clostridia bacterium]
MSNQTNKTSGISVQAEHIFPIIKKWLYSEKEIFLRELVSNACDAVTKLRRLSSLGEYDGEGEKYAVTVSFSATAKTITITDNGIGMTAEEVDKYICSMALSGALDFIEKYEGSKNDQAGIIGHFGLGFYSAFMVADTVDVHTRSYTGAPAVDWTCTEAGQYEMGEGQKEEHGTEVILHLNQDNEEYLSEFKLREILERYCTFMPTEIYLVDEDKEEEEREGEGTPAPINDPHPLWQKNASDCTEAEYTAFYQKVFSDFREPLFSLHLNADYPLNFKGILYFPKIREGYESPEGIIKLYYNQVFVADNIKEVIPEYLLMLRGVLDCPELPLNVSRSYLQNNVYVAKVSAYIAKKVADKLVSLCNVERERFETLYPDLKTFISYACICDRKFYDRVSSALLFKNDAGQMISIDDYLKDKDDKTIYYATDEQQQSSYIRMFQEKGISVLLFDHILDTRLAESIERYREEDGIKFLRIDASTDAIKGEGVAEADTAKQIFEGFSSESLRLTVEAQPLADAQTPAILTISEDSRRMQDMMRMYAPDSPEMPLEATLVLNTNNDLILKLNDGTFGELAPRVAQQIFSLALLSSKKLNATEMQTLLQNSYALLGEL